MSGYWPNGYWNGSYWYSYYPQGVFQPAPINYVYQWPAFIVGPCGGCNRNFALVNPVQGQPVPKFCGECTPPVPTKP